RRAGPSAPRSRGGSGRRGMRERVAALGGELSAGPPARGRLPGAGPVPPRPRRRGQPGIRPGGTGATPRGGPGPPRPRRREQPVIRPEGTGAPPGGAPVKVNREGSGEPLVILVGGAFQHVVMQGGRA